MNVVIAYVLALPADREKEARSTGLRTFPLVAVASCGYMLLATSILGSSSESTSRIIQGLITGIGFIGAGAILKGRGSVHGTATAASIWNTGAMHRITWTPNADGSVRQRWESTDAKGAWTVAFDGL